MLDAVPTWADTAKVTGLGRQVYELHLHALGALAEAERGALTAVTADEVTRLAADAADGEDRPQDLLDAAVDESLRAAQARVADQAARSQHSN